MATEFDFGPVGETELEEVRGFLQTVFGTPENWKPFTREVMLWKCFTPHPLWNGPRSYVLRYQGRIVAHGSLVPAEFCMEAGTVATACIIDWAASRKLPGAGGLLYRNIQKLTGTLIGIGGSDNARTVLPRLGFKSKTQFGIYVRVVRPWNLYRDAGSRNWKEAARLARNLLLIARAAARPGNDWSAQLVPRFDLSVPLPNPAVWHNVVCRRTADLLNYFLACPAAVMSGYVLRRAHRQVGYFVLSRVGAECRIAEVWVNSDSAPDWRSAYALAARFAAMDPAVSRVLAAASAPHCRTAIEAAGLRQVDSQDLSVKDPQDKLGGQTAISMSLLENDGFYL